MTPGLVPPSEIEREIERLWARSESLRIARKRLERELKRAHRQKRLADPLFRDKMREAMRKWRESRPKREDPLAGYGKKARNYYALLRYTETYTRKRMDRGEALDAVRARFGDPAQS